MGIMGIVRGDWPPSPLELLDAISQCGVLFLQRVEPA
jgi:hypothetical protein